jgi:polar amino acid transport system permease protein/polar amino acid transport system substrate-binding protein
VGTEPAPLRVGMDPRAAPWVFVPGHDYTREAYDQAPKLAPRQLVRAVGLEIDILHELERHLGAPFEIVQTRWIDLESGLLDARYDLILNAWTPSATTPRAIVATDPYYLWGLLMAARRDDATIQAIGDLAGKRLGHITDASILPALRAMSQSVGAERVVVDQGGDELFRRLGKGELDAVVFDSVFVRWRVARDAAFRVVGQPLNQLGYRIGVRREDRALFERLQKAVHAFTSSPEAGSIRRKWEGGDAPAP